MALQVAHKSNFTTALRSRVNANVDRLVAGALSVLIVMSLTWVLYRPVATTSPAGGVEFRSRLLFLSRLPPAEIASMPIRPNSPGPMIQNGKLADAHTKAAEPSRADPIAIDALQGPARPLMLYRNDGQLLPIEGLQLDDEPEQGPPGSMTRSASGTPSSSSESLARKLRTRNASTFARDTSIPGQPKGLLVIPLGKRDQPARPRPPPQAAGSLALHEGVGDLGNEAKGNAYAAAPIRPERVPDLNGSASLTIRHEMDELVRQYGLCKEPAFSQFVPDVRRYLRQLEAVEHSIANGADPVLAEHMLPREADMAYNQARRALWYARSKLVACRR